VGVGGGGGGGGVAGGGSVVGGGPRHCSGVEEMWWRPNAVEYERHDSSSNSRCGRIGVGEVQVVGLYLAAVGVGIGRDDGNHAAASKGREGKVQWGAR
jgi:hypothetical protein